MSFWRFWGRALRDTFSIWWFVFGAVSAVLPAIVTLIQRYYPSLANVAALKWTADNQVEIHFYIASGCFLTYLAYAPYKLYRELASKHSLHKEKRPRIICETIDSTATPKVTHDQSGKIIVRVTVNLVLTNAGDADACNYKIAVYSCWLREPTNVDKWANDFFSKWPPRQKVQYPFSQSTLAYDVGQGRKGITSLDEIVFVIEIESRADTSDGVICKDEIWLCWALDHPIRPPNPATVASIRPHVENLKSIAVGPGPISH